MKLSLNSQIALGAILGITLGILCGHSHLGHSSNSSVLLICDLLGKIFINLLKMIMIPLIFTSITAGIANLKNSKHTQRVWPILLVYSVTTTSLAALTGLTVMNIVKPGVGLNIQLFKENINQLHIHSISLSDLIHQLIDNVISNPIAAMGQNNVLAVVIFAAFVGIAIIALGEKTQGILKIINELFEVMMKIVQWIMYLAPIGIMGLLAKLVAQANLTVLFVLSKYILVVVLTTLFHGLITLPLILWIVAKISPIQFFAGMKEAFITAFSTSSSTATLPVSLRCITDHLKVDKAIARFVLPVGATLNMDGTAMYESMAALFVANLCGIHLNIASQIVVMLTAMMASVGAPGIPSAGMITMVLVLQSVGLPTQAVAILIAIDRPLDTIRTVVNVEGDCVGACVAAKMLN